MRRLAGILALCAAMSASGATAYAKKKTPPKRTAAEQSEKGTADKDTIRLVEYFTKAETSELDYSMVPKFMAVDVKTLPSGLRAPYRAKKLELNTLKKLTDNKKKAPIRRAGKEEKPACEPEKGTPQYVKSLGQFGFEEIYEDELNFLMKRTRCTECELHEEASLTTVIVPAEKKDGRAMRYLFLSKNDPWLAIVAQYRAGNDGGTNFFGSFHGACH